MAEITVDVLGPIQSQSGGTGSSETYKQLLKAVDKQGSFLDSALSALGANSQSTKEIANDIKKLAESMKSATDDLQRTLSNAQSSLSGAAQNQNNKPDVQQPNQSISPETEVNQSSQPVPPPELPAQESDKKNKNKPPPEEKDLSVAGRIRSFLGDIIEKAKKIPEVMVKSVTGAPNAGGDTSGMLARGTSSLVGLNVISGMQKLYEASSSLLGADVEKIQKSMMMVSQYAAQTKVAFGETDFGDVIGSAEQYRLKWAETRRELLATEQEIAKVGSSLEEYMATDVQINNLGNLTEATRRFGSSLSPMNVALSVSKATGTDSAQIAKIMSMSYGEMGKSAEESALGVGVIGVAAEKAKMNFGLVAKSISDNAGSLKMWGGTIESVSPVFTAFAESLSGVGKKGLTQEFVSSLTSGINQMSLSQRALMGMQLPGRAASAGGAIGTGLEMEQALEQGGEGMKKIMDSFSATLKQFGGGQIITRQQAIDSPELQNSFLVQRGLLKQMANVGEAQATQMLSVMKDIDAAGGLDISGETRAEDKLSELMGVGKEMAQQYTTVGEKFQAQYDSAVQTAGDDLIKSINYLTKQIMEKANSIFKELPNSIIKTVAAISGSGKVDVSGVVESSKALGTKVISDVFGAPDKGPRAGEKQDVARVVEVGERLVESRKMRENYTARESDEKLGRKFGVPQFGITGQDAALVKNKMNEIFNNVIGGPGGLARESVNVVGQNANEKRMEGAVRPIQSPADLKNLTVTPQTQKQKVNVEFDFNLKTETVGKKLIIDLEPIIKKIAGEEAKSQIKDASLSGFIQ